jgi:hypothetical protein
MVRHAADQQRRRGIAMARVPLTSNFDAEKIGPDTPLRLAVAAAIAYPDGSMPASGLRREAARGRLVIERTAGKDYTTLANISRMRELCRVEVKVLGFGCARRNMIEPEDSRTQQPGSLKTDHTARARDAALMIVEGLRQHSRDTSTKSKSRKPRRACVHQLQSL